MTGFSLADINKISGAVSEELRRRETDEDAERLYNSQRAVILFVLFHSNSFEDICKVHGTLPIADCLSPHPLRPEDRILSKPIPSRSWTPAEWKAKVAEEEVLAEQAAEKLRQAQADAKAEAQRLEEEAMAAAAVEPYLRQAAEFEAEQQARKAAAAKAAARAAAVKQHQEKKVAEKALEKALLQEVQNKAAKMQEYWTARRALAAQTLHQQYDISKQGLMSTADFTTLVRQIDPDVGYDSIRQVLRDIGAEEGIEQVHLNRWLQELFHESTEQEFEDLVSALVNGYDSDTDDDILDDSVLQYSDDEEDLSPQLPIQAANATEVENAEVPKETEKDVCEDEDKWEQAIQEAAQARKEGNTGNAETPQGLLSALRKHEAQKEGEAEASTLHSMNNESEDEELDEEERDLEIRIAYWTDERLQLAEDLFQACDVDNSGAISLKEFTELVQQLDPDTTEEDVAQTMLEITGASCKDIEIEHLMSWLFTMFKDYSEDDFEETIFLLMGGEDASEID